MAANRITASTYRRIKIELDLSESEAGDLANSIVEAAGSVDNWRSDPRQLQRLNEVLRGQLGMPVTYSSRTGP